MSRYFFVEKPYIDPDFHLKQFLFHFRKEEFDVQAFLLSRIATLTSIQFSPLVSDKIKRLQPLNMWDLEVRLLSLICFLSFTLTFNILSLSLTLSLTLPFSLSFSHTFNLNSLSLPISLPPSFSPLFLSPLFLSLFSFLLSLLPTEIRGEDQAHEHNRRRHRYKLHTPSTGISAERRLPIGGVLLFARNSKIPGRPPIQSK